MPNNCFNSSRHSLSSLSMPYVGKLFFPLFLFSPFSHSIAIYLVYNILCYAIRRLQVNTVNTFVGCFFGILWSSYWGMLARLKCLGRRKHTSRNPVIEISNKNASASSSILCSETLTELPSPADFFRTSSTASRLSDRNLRPCSRVCWF